MKELICIVCPNGCAMEVSADGDSIKVSGNKCPKGEKFAIDEETNPMRTICSTVKTSFHQIPVLPVRVSSEIPKNRIFDVMAELSKVLLTEPIGRGDVVIQNVLGLGVDIIATSGILEQKVDK